MTECTPKGRYSRSVGKFYVSYENRPVSACPQCEAYPSCFQIRFASAGLSARASRTVEAGKPSRSEITRHDNPSPRSRATSSRLKTRLGLPQCLPWRCASAIPARVRSTIIPRSNSASIRGALKTIVRARAVANSDCSTFSRIVETLFQSRARCSNGDTAGGNVSQC